VTAKRARQKVWRRQVKRVVITGGTGFVGKSVVLAMAAAGHKVTSLSSKTDLKDEKVCLEALKGAEVVVHLAAQCAGILSNQRYPADFFYNNMRMGMNVVHSCHLLKTPRLVLCGTVCSYGRITPSPFKEESLFCGRPEETNLSYGLAKAATLEMAAAYHKQYGLNHISLLPTNMYGVGDNFGDLTSHLIPACFQRIDLALKARKVPVFWGSGEATRDFLNVRDAARAFVLAVESDYVGGPLNLGPGKCYSVRQTVGMVAELMGYKGPIEFDRSRPDGQPHRLVDATKAKEALGWEAETPFMDGLRETLVDYRARFGE
jgi:GDP-L-fucose synthase